MLAFPAAAQATTIGLTGGAPTTAPGQSRVAKDGVSVLSWTRSQTWLGPLDSRLTVRGSLRDGLTFPAGVSTSLWLTEDEPWLDRVGPAFIQQQVDLIHAAGGRAITSQGWAMARKRWPSRAQLSAYAGDILSVNSFPQPMNPLAEVGPKVALMHSIARGRPVWAALQVCSRSNFATGRVPSPGAEWKMARAALDNGARGIMFFGSGYKSCFHTAHDRAAGFNWSAYRHTVRPTIRRIRAYSG